MGDRNITLFALHTHGDTQFGPSDAPDVGSEDTPSPKEAASKAKSLFSKGKQGTENEETDIDVSGSEEESGGNLGTLLVGLFVLAAIAMVAKKVGGGKEAEVDLTESDDL